MRWRRATAAAAAPARPLDFELATARLRLRPLTEMDVGNLHHLWTAPGVRRYLWDDRVMRPEQTRDLIMQSEYLFQERGLGLWGAWLSENEMIGFGGYWLFRDEHELELLYGVAEAWWMQGYAREIAQRLVAYAFDELHLDELRATTDAANLASMRLLRRLGFMPDRQRGAGLKTAYLRLPRGVFEGPP